MNKFWNIENNAEERILIISGPIAEESWLDDEITPNEFKKDLESAEGDITVWINSPGGDVFAAASIYNMLLEYPHKVTVKIDGLAASAASVIAMAGDKVLMSPVSMLMIHNPATFASGQSKDMQKAMEMLDSVKESIINAYIHKTGLPHDRLSELMDNETWMDAKEAVKQGFCDEIFDRNKIRTEDQAGYSFSSHNLNRCILAKIKSHTISRKDAYKCLDMYEKIF